MTAELLIYAVIAAGLVFWLRNVLGTRHGDERERPNPFTAPVEKPAAEERPASISGDIEGVTLPLGESRPFLPRNVTIEGAATENALADISRQQKDFDIAAFAQAAQDAFAYIVEAFAQGDRDTLRNLLVPKVYDVFDGALKEREAKGETVSTEIHSVRRADIIDAKIVGGDAFVTFRFIADETCVIRDSEGKILSGDPDRITEMNDIWVFTREIRSRDPRWLVSSTSDGDVKEDIKTPMPEA